MIPQQPSARCVIQRHEILIDRLDFEINIIHDHDDVRRAAKSASMATQRAKTRSAIYTPLIV